MSGTDCDDTAWFESRAGRRFRVRAYRDGDGDLLGVLAPHEVAVLIERIPDVGLRKSFREPPGGEWQDFFDQWAAESDTFARGLLDGSWARAARKAGVMPARGITQRT